MASIQLRGDDKAFMQERVRELQQDLAQAGLSQELQVESPGQHNEGGNTRGLDPVSWISVAVIAAGAGGALTTLLGKDGFLSALARVLEKYVEGREAEVLIEDGDKKMQISGSLSAIKETLRQINQ